MGKIWSINPLLAIIHNTFFYSIICSTVITNHALSRIEVYVNAFIERDIAYYCRCIQRVEGLLAQNIYKTRRFVMILTKMKHTFLLFTTVKCYISSRVELTQKVRCPIDVKISLSMMAWEQHGILTHCLPQRVALVTN